MGPKWGRDGLLTPWQNACCCILYVFLMFFPGKGVLRQGPTLACGPLALQGVWGGRGHRVKVQGLFGIRVATLIQKRCQNRLG